VIVGAEKTRYTSFSQREAQLISDLLLKRLDQVPSNYVLIEQANVTASETTVPYIRLFKVNPVHPLSATAAAGTASSQKPVVQ
jgi:uncharacterized protein (UPF0305 family)